MQQYLPTLTIVSIVGSGLMAGLLFAFSNFVMRSLGELPAEYGQQAMQRINIRIINPVFLLLFMGTTVFCVLLVLLCLLNRDAPGTGWLLVGALTYLVGPFGITMACNVPLNNALARATSVQAPTTWPKYMQHWLRWNHRRTVLGMIACVLLAIGLQRLG